MSIKYHRRGKNNEECTHSSMRIILRGGNYRPPNLESRERSFSWNHSFVTANASRRDLHEARRLRKLMERSIPRGGGGAERWRRYKIKSWNIFFDAPGYRNRRDNSRVRARATRKGGRAAGEKNFRRIFLSARLRPSFLQAG